LYVNLRGGEHGLYSNNQATVLLESYLRSHRLAGVRFTTVDDTRSTPFATGSAAFASRGGREYVQVYVALTTAGDRWTISQINIY
jgi:hypothetical protein